MSLRALLFSKNTDTSQLLATLLRDAGIQAEVCSDIFSAIEKGTKQTFPCIIVDWPDQPEASFLLKRARESGANRNTTAVAIVDNEPPADQQREHRLEFLIYRPIRPEEAGPILSQVRQKMQVQGAFSEEMSPAVARRTTESVSPPVASSEDDDPNVVALAGAAPKTSVKVVSREEPVADAEETSQEEEIRPRPGNVGRRFAQIAAALFLMAAGYLSFRAIPAYRYLATAPEGPAQVLREGITNLLYPTKSNAPSVASIVADTQQQAFLRHNADSAKVQPSDIGLLNAEVIVPDGLKSLLKAADFPLPSPIPPAREQAPTRVERKIPDSIRGSAPIAPPVTVTVGPAQMMPVSAPVPSVPMTIDTISLGEEAARALITRTVPPVYPSEAMPQKLQGAVVLQTLIGRDGSVQDVKLARGYFLLGRAAIAAVKQWRFQPQTVNGKPVSVQTVITVHFTYPSS